jgi:hypothetical protein
MSFDYKPHIMKLKGKEYLPVAARIAWLRSEHPGAQIDAELVTLDLDAQLAVFRATVVIPETGARATDYGSETAKDFGDYIEKASTKAIGRAIAALGYGTLMALELDEGERVVDSPTTPAARNGGGSAASGAAPTPTAATIGVSAQASAKEPTMAASRSGGTTVSAPASTPAPDPLAALRAEVVALLADDGPALALLMQQRKPLPPEQDAMTLAKTRAWLLQRKEQARPKSVRLGEQIARASTDDAIKLVLADARQAQERKEITEAEYKGLYQAGEARKAELSAPLLAGGPTAIAS